MHVTDVTSLSRQQNLTFEVTTRCNLKCVMCPHGLPGGYPGQRDADDTLMEAIVASLDRIDILRPTGVGEPLLSSAFWTLVDKLKGRKRPELSFVTNGILLTPANVDRLALAPIRNVTVSVDAVRPETHLQIRGNDLSKTLAGIRNIASIKNKSENNFDLFLSFVIMKRNYVEVPDFVSMAAEMGADHVYFEHLTPLATNPRDWNVHRSSWIFNYDEQDMRHDPVLADAVMGEAVDRADKLGIGLGSYHVFLDPVNEAAYQNRPSRRKFCAPQHQKTSVAYER